VILYLDTSALVKLYVQEEGSERVLDEVRGASVVATSTVAYPETRAALARLRRERLISSSDLGRARAALDRDWRGLWILPVTDELAQSAGSLAEAHGLRGFDAVHLASFCLALEGPGPVAEVRFSSFDQRLNRAARNEERRRRGL
jgi:uncharacterized protein